jgi:hypothetical protein
MMAWHARKSGRAAELKERAKEVEQRLPVIAAQLGILWNEVMGSGRPVPSEIQLTSTGTEMTAEEHVVTSETHLGYAEASEAGQGPPRRTGRGQVN